MSQNLYFQKPKKSLTNYYSMLNVLKNIINGEF